MRTRAEPPFWSTQPVIDSVLDRMQIRLLCAPRSTGSAADHVWVKVSVLR